MRDDEIVTAVRERYGAVAGSGLSNDSRGVQAVAEAFGYSAEELASLPAEANMGLSCGNPTATANLRPGEVVLDLGCGGGIDVLLAARKVGPTGRAIGVDMTPEMIERAQRNAAGVANTEFHLARMEALPLPDASVDCVISNCVINLVPDKPAVLREVFRVLRPGGRMAVSDIGLKKTLPPEVSRNLMAYIGCIAGAVLIEEYQRLLANAGFRDVEVIDTAKDLNAYSQAGAAACCAATGDDAPCCGPEPLHDGLTRLLAEHNVNDFAASVRVFALKPR
jgi:ubiquinone/menaquinone biosynthesis C-methylase UbiE